MSPSIDVLDSHPARMPEGSRIMCCQYIRPRPYHNCQSERKRSEDRGGPDIHWTRVRASNFRLWNVQILIVRLLSVHAAYSKIQMGRRFGSAIVDRASGLRGVLGTSGYIYIYLIFSVKCDVFPVPPDTIVWSTPSA